jgi:hypothetical protein
MEIGKEIAEALSGRKSEKCLHGKGLEMETWKISDGKNNGKG